MQIIGEFMMDKSLGTRALQVAGSVALCTFAIASQAGPISLLGTCHLSDMEVGKGSCHLTYSLFDGFITPSSDRKSLIKIDGIIVAQFVNDIANPYQYAIPLVSGTTEVTCGVNHTVTAFVAPAGVATLYVKVGSLPPVLCPVAP
jgi:hypothetical protein